MNRGYVYRHVVQPADAGRELAEHHGARYPAATRAEWAVRAARGDLRVNGRGVDAGYRLRAGDVIEFARGPWEEERVPLDFGVVFEDEHVLVVDKPAGLQVQPGGAFLEHTLWTRVRHSAPQRADASPVHRLGRGTSGLILFGLTPRARSALSEQFRRHGPTKTYLALVPAQDWPAAHVGSGSLQVRAPIGRVAHGPMTAWCARPDGKAAHTRVRALRRVGPHWLVAAQPITGRPDQIRIHLAALGAPIAGDPLFGPGGHLAHDVPPGRGGYFLHASGLAFAHPIDARRIKLRSRPPWLAAAASVRGGGGSLS